MDKQQLIRAIKTFERDHKDFGLTVTFGHVLVHDQDLSAVSYDEEQGLKDLLAYFERLGWEPVLSEDQQLIGVKKDKASVRLGLGGQVQWTYHDFIHMHDLDQAYLNFVEGLFDELKRRGQVLLATGHQPVTNVQDIKPLPTRAAQAYWAYTNDKEAMRDFLFAAATTTVSMNFAHSDNFQKRLQAANLIQPVLGLLFDNASWVNGEANKVDMYNLNHLHEANEEWYTLPYAMEPQFKYEEMALDMMAQPAILGKKDGDVVPVGGILVSEAYAEDKLSEEDVVRIMDLAQGSLRMTDAGLALANVDSVPYPLNMAYVLMVKALLYNADHITALEKMLEEIKEDKLTDARQEVLSKGMEATIGNGTFHQMVKDLFFMITLTIEPEEQHYLQPLNSLLFKNIKTRDVGARQFASMLHH